MFLHKLGSSDARFRTLSFKPGLNLLVADRTEVSEQGDSRNGTGKSSFVRILRYVLGGSVPNELQSEALAEHSFYVDVELPSEGSQGGTDAVTVTRPLRPSTRVDLLGWSRASVREQHSDEWRALQAKFLFKVPPEASRPTVGQLWGTLIRTYFGKPTKESRVGA